VSPTPRKPRKKPDDAESAAADAEVAEQEATAAAEGERSEAAKPKRARRKAAPKAEPAAETEAKPKAAAKKAAPKAELETEPAKTQGDKAADEVEAAEEPEAEKTEAPAAGAPAKPPRRTRRAKAGEAPPAPAPAAKRAARDPNAGPPMVRAHAKYVRTSARKARLVCDHIRGKSVEEARAILAHANRDVARDWMKLLESAVANAEHNHELVGDDLRIHAVKADEGPTLKRFRPRAMGRATQIRKRTSHLTITLTPKDGE
jgi:ribosomal protein L22